MGNCISDRSKEKSKKNAINQEVTPTLTAQPSYIHNHQSQNPLLLKKRYAPSHDCTYQQEHFSHSNREQQDDFKAFQQSNRQQKTQLINIRVTTSTDLAEQPILRQYEKGFSMSSGGSNTIKALFPNGMEHLKESKTITNGNKEEKFYPKGSNFTQRTGSFDEAITVNNFMSSNMHNDLKKVRNGDENSSYQKSKNNNNNELDYLPLMQSQEGLTKNQVLQLMKQRGTQNGFLSKNLGKKLTMGCTNEQTQNKCANSLI